jgi:hypothetical protein
MNGSLLKPECTHQSVPESERFCFLYFSEDSSCFAGLQNNQSMRDATMPAQSEPHCAGAGKRAEKNITALLIPNAILVCCWASPSQWRCLIAPDIFMYPPVSLVFLLLIQYPAVERNRCEKCNQALLNHRAGKQTVNAKRTDRFDCKHK